MGLVAGLLPVFAHAAGYVVKPGDTFIGIAKKFKVSVSSLKSANIGLFSTHTLKPGMTISIPENKADALPTTATVAQQTPRASFKRIERFQVGKRLDTNSPSLLPIVSQTFNPKRYVVQAVAGAKKYAFQKNDWEWTVAKHLGVSLASLRKANPGLVWTKLKVGDKINVPTESPALMKGKAAEKQSGNGQLMLASERHIIKTRYVVVNGSRVSVREDDDATSRKVAVVDAGAHAKILDRSGEWYKLEFDSGMRGWVKGSLLAPGKASKLAVPVKRRHVDEDEDQDETPRRIVRRIPTRDDVDEQVAPRRKKSTRVAATLVASHKAAAKKSKRALSTQDEDAAAYNNAVAQMETQDESSGGGEPAEGKSNSIVSAANRLKGVRYRYGGMSSRGLDCSGFTSTVFARNGVRLPRTAQEQASKGTAVPKSALKKGDLVFFHTVRGRRVGHVGIYVGNNKFIHASSGGGKVKVSELSGYYARRFVGARRVK